MLDAVFIFGYGFNGTCLFARHGDIDDCMIRAAVVAYTAADAFVVVNCSLAYLRVSAYCVFGAIVHAASCHATTAKACHFIIGLYAGRARLINHAHYVVFRFRLIVASESHLDIR